MLHGEIIAVCSEIHTKHTNTLCGRNGEFLNFKPDGIDGTFQGLVNFRWKLKCAVFSVQTAPHCSHFAPSLHILL